MGLMQMLSGMRRRWLARHKYEARHELLGSRRCRFELMEERRVMNADPLHIGVVYVEEDGGSDLHGDTFEVTFTGGAPGTELTRLVINGDKNGIPGYQVGDVLFDTLLGGLGPDQPFPFTIISQNGIQQVTAHVADGGMSLVLEFKGFHAGDKLVFQIDVDEVQEAFDSNNTDYDWINQGLDPITSGVEFQGSTLTATFTAPHYQSATGTGEFRNFYDANFAGKNLDLPADDFNGKRDRTAGGVASLQQVPKPISIAGTVYHDTDLDLTQDPGEQGLSGVTLALWKKDANGNYVFTGHTVQTDAQGNYRFGEELNLMPGTYQVRETQPGGYYSVGATPGTVAGTPSGSVLGGDKDVLTEITIPLGDTDAIDYDFAEAQPASISGYVYADRNNNGIKEAGEPGIGGVTIQIIPINTIAAQSTLTVTTDANGFYQVTGLAPGTYRVVEVQQPAGYYDGLDTPGTVNGVTVGTATNPGDSLEGIFLGGNQSGINYNFGELEPGSISGRVHLTDRQGNCFTEEALNRPLAGVTVILRDAQGNILRQTLTNENGEYRFDNLAPGTYVVQEITPEGLIDGGDHVGTVNGVKTGSITENDVIGGIVIGPGTAGINYDFCEHEPSSLSGFVYHDANNNGVFDAGEQGISGATLNLYNAQNVLVATVVTDANGHYVFEDIAAGNYRIVEQQPNGWIDGKDAAGSLGGTAVNPGDEIREIAVLWGDNGVHYDFGELLPGSIEGIVYVDPNQNLVRDPGEAPIAGVTIHLLDANGVIVATTTTDAQGRYRFDNLAPGTYGVREIQPEGYFHGGQTAGSKGGNDSQQDLITVIPIGSGEHLVEYNFAEIPPSSLTGIVFADPNQNCTFDQGESPIAGVTVRLYDNQGNLIATTTTDAQGRYKFENLRPGTYTVRETQPAGYLQGGQKAGSGGGDDSQQDVISSIAIGAGVDLVDYNFCEVPPSSLAGRVFADFNEDCEFNGEDTPLSGVRIDLYDNHGNLVATTFTDADGNYKFDNLAPGEYTIVESQPMGYFNGGASPGTGGGVGSHDPDDPDCGCGDPIGGGAGEVEAGNKISQIHIPGGAELVNYDFCEIPPALLSGYVFQDGDAIIDQSGLPPENLRAIRDGILTADDKPLAGVTLELRDGLTGEPIDGADLLPGVYGPGPVRVVTDANGYYEFKGLPPGNYAVYQVQPEGYFDGIDHEGTTLGIAVNPDSGLDPAFLSTFADLPANDAIVRIPVGAGQHSQMNNFSEVLVTKMIIPPPPNPPMPPLPPEPPPLVINPAFAPLPLLPLAPPAAPHLDAGGLPAFTWHLSIIDAGAPRGDFAVVDGEIIFKNASYLVDRQDWVGKRVDEGVWTLKRDRDGDGIPDDYEEDEALFGLEGAIPLMGDFNGDGIAEKAIYLHGEWFVDLNGNGRWDDEDLWAKLGSETDLPVVGDWDGDGKDDIGIFGPEWPGDPEAIENEPGLPDPENQRPLNPKPKNLPPNPDEAPVGHRLLKHTASGKARADLIDHVFRYGGGSDKPVAGDWNGDGIDNIGIFRDGVWYLDTDGDGRYTANDAKANFGQKGDLPVVGDWDGDGVDDLGVYRAGTWIIDSNNNRTLDATDKVFEMGGADDLPVVGDVDGDGIDDPGIYRDAQPPEVRQARKAG